MAKSQNKTLSDLCQSLLKIVAEAEKPESEK